LAQAVDLCFEFGNLLRVGRWGDGGFERGFVVFLWEDFEFALFGGWAFGENWVCDEVFVKMVLHVVKWIWGEVFVELNLNVAIGTGFKRDFRKW
jgi:hypothetical protein